MVTVTKSKESDHKYVLILAEQILKPLMKKYLSGENKGEDILKSKESKETERELFEVKEINFFNCPFCDKTFILLQDYKAKKLKCIANFKNKKKLKIMAMKRK